MKTRKTAYLILPTLRKASKFRRKIFESPYLEPIKEDLKKLRARMIDENAIEPVTSMMYIINKIKQKKA